MPAGFGNVLLCVVPETLLLTGLEQVCQVLESMARKLAVERVGISWLETGAG